MLSNTSRSKTTFIKLFLISIFLQIVVSFYFYKGSISNDSTVIGIAIDWIKILVSIGLSSILVSFPLLFLSRIYEKIYFYVMLFIIITFYLIECFLVNIHNTIYSYGVLQAMGGTNPNETSEYFESIDWSTLLYPSLWAILIILFSIYFSKKDIWIRIYSYFSNRVSKITKIIISLILFIAVVSLNYKYYKISDSLSQISAQTSSTIDRFIWNSYGFINDINKIDEGIEKIEHQNIEVLSKHKFDNHNLVIIVGESLSRNYMHCYGYNLNTTPKLDSLISTGDMIKFSDAVCSVPGTVASVVRMFSFLRNESNKNNWYDYPILTEVLEKGGYETYWVTNQEMMGKFVQPISTLVSLSDSFRAVNPRSNSDNYRKKFLDEEVLPFIKKSSKDKSLCQIIHLQGSHQNYFLRYSDEFAKFRAEDLLESKGADKDAMIAAYINSVYYNDYVVGEIIKYYSDSPSLVIYLPDHGEIVYDDPEIPNTAAHALRPNAINIPFFVYMSPSFRNSYPEVYEQVNNVKDRPIMTDLLPNAVCGLVGIKHKLDDEKYDFFSDKYDTSRKRVVYGYEGDSMIM